MSVRDLFTAMSYGPAPDSPAEALAWIESHGGRLGHWIDGAFGTPDTAFAIANPATGAVLAHVAQGTAADVDAAVTSARHAQTEWAQRSGHDRARVLYALARLVQKHSRLLALLQTLETGKPLRDSHDADLPLVARHFSYHAGLAQLSGTEFPGLVPLGVCAAVIPWHAPLRMLAWKVAPALAAGNAVVLKPSRQTPLTALLFADLSRQAGLPPGVLNVVTGDGATGAALVAHPGVAKVAFAGSTKVGRQIRQAVAGSGKALTLMLGGASVVIVFEDADLDSAVEGVIDGVFTHHGQAGARLLVQEGLADRFHTKLRRRIERLRIGDPLDKCTDIGALPARPEVDRIAHLVAATPGAELFRPAPPPADGRFCAPMLIIGLSPASAPMQDEIPGPVGVATTFRTPAEAVELANNSRHGLAASVWTENGSLALAVARKLKAGVVWINATHQFDAAAGFGGLRDSGFGRDGGLEGFRDWLKPAKAVPPPAPRLAPMPAPERPKAPDIDRTAKLFIGGKQVRPDGGGSRAVWSAQGRLLGHAPLGNRKDIRNAVEAARAATGWAATSGYNRAQVLYYMAENLSARADEFAARLRDLTGTPGEAEVEAAICRLFDAAASAGSVEGRVKPAPFDGLVMALPGPMGVVGILCPDAAPLLGLVSLMAPAIAMGNTCVLVPSEPFPLAATDFCQVIETSDLPAGVVNLVTGAHRDLAPTLAGHMGVDAVWCFSGADLSAAIEAASAENLKRSWIGTGCEDASPAEVLRQAVEIRTVWAPAGV